MVASVPKAFVNRLLWVSITPTPGRTEGVMPPTGRVDASALGLFFSVCALLNSARLSAPLMSILLLPPKLMVLVDPTDVVIAVDRSFALVLL